MNSTKTRYVKASEIERKWYVADATGLPLGRVAAKVAFVLMGKHKPTYTPNVDSGDCVVVVNVEKVHLSGKKPVQKIDFRHSHWPGGDKTLPYWKMLKDYPERAMELAVKGMLPKTRLGRQMIKKLKVYRDAQHPHGLLNPQPLTIKAG